MTESIQQDIRRNDSLTEAVVEAEEESSTLFPSKFRRRVGSIIKNKGSYVGGLALVGASSIGNLLNFVFNSYLGRILSFQEFAMIGLVGGLLSFASIIFGAFSTTANYKSAFLIGKFGDDAAYSFWKYIRRRALYLSVILTAVWLLAIPIVVKMFSSQTPWLYVLFGLILLVGLANGADRGFLSAKLRFGSIAALSILDPVIRIVTAVLLVIVGLKFWTFSAIPLALLGVFILGWLLIIWKHTKKAISVPLDEIKHFPYKFFSASMLTGFSSIAFSSFDILLTNHYLPSLEAGKYALLSLVGRMVYYLGGLTSPFIIPLLSRTEGTNKNSKHTMYLLFACTGLLSLFGFVSFGLLGFFTIPLLYGTKAKSIVPLLIFYTFGMMCYAVSKVLVSYFLVKRAYLLTVLTSCLVIVQVGLIAMFHANISTVANIMAILWVCHLLLTAGYFISFDMVKKLSGNISITIEREKSNINE